MNYTTLNIQGNLFSEETLHKIENGDTQGQQATDFGFEPNTNLRSEIEYAWSRVKLDWKHFFEKSQNLPSTDPYGTSITRRWMEQFFSSLGFSLSRRRQSLQGENNQTYVISHTAENLNDLPIHIVGFFEPDKPDKNTLDIKTSGGSSRLSPHATVQEYLNVTEHLFGLATNGFQLRLIRDSGRLIKLTYLEFDLKRMLDEDKYSEFTLLFRLLHGSRFPTNKNESDSCLLEKYYQESIENGNRIRNGLSQAVKESLVALGNGLLNQPENQRLRERIQSGQLTASEFNHQLLRLIYRLLFLIVTEERDLIYDPGNESEEQKRHKDIYYKYYGLARLRKRSANRFLFEPEYTDLWQGLLQTFSFFEPGKGGQGLGIHALGGELFQASAIQDIRASQINNRVLLECIRSLNEFEDARKNRVLINFRSLDVEELGSIYEGLLELSPVIVPDGQGYRFTYEKGSERSSSGSHYTPEDLVKPLIQHSLEYLIEDRVQPFYKGKMSADAAIQSLLDLKVADVACGSGHILLSAARRIAHEVARIESGEQQPNPRSFRKAIKQVIRHCIYGVDKNPLAVELCKVALWLESHAPGEPLNFLDHHIKCGDAIIGLAHRSELESGIANEAFKTLPGDDKDIAKIFRDKNAKERKERVVKALQLKAEFEKSTENSVQEAIAEYKTFNQLPETSPEEIERKAKAYKKFMDGKGYTFLKAMADTQVAQFFISKTVANKEYLMTDADYRLIISGYKGWQDRKVAKATVIAHEQRFFHWFIEFPEVFQDGGFDCVLGNPPFLLGKKISGSFGDNYLNEIKNYYYPTEGSVDLVVYFIRRISTIIQQRRFFSIIASKVIAQGDSRLAGLDLLTTNSYKIVFAIKSMTWPGKAAVEVALISIHRNSECKACFIGNKKVDAISSYLDEGNEFTQPNLLAENAKQSFQGSVVLGNGFVLSPQEAKIFSQDPSNKDVIFPYLNGEDLNSSIDQKANRYIINFFDWDEEYCRKNYPKLYQLVYDTVRVQRLEVKRESYRNKWWQYAEKGVELYKTIKNNDKVLVLSQNTKPVAFSLVDRNQVFDSKLVIFSKQNFQSFAVLQSNIHNTWAWKLGTTLGAGTLTYTPTAVYQSYPLPNAIESQNKQKLESVGEAYHENRRQLMLGIQLGLTKTYNLFHSNAITSQAVNETDKQVAALQKHLAKTPDTISFNEAIQGILQLRALHVQMDEAVLDAYGWSDIALRHNFYEVDYLPENDRIRYTIHPEARKEVLKRLLDLNHKIHAEEVAAGLWDKKKGKPGAPPKGDDAKGKDNDYDTTGDNDPDDDNDADIGGLFAPVGRG